MSFIKAILVGHVINQGREIYNGGHACLTKENNLGLQQSAMESLQIARAQFITKCDGQLLQIATAFLLQSATGITKCDDYYKVRQYRSTKVFVHARENLLTENLREMLTIKIPIMIMV